MKKRRSVIMDTNVKTAFHEYITNIFYPQHQMNLEVDQLLPRLQYNDSIHEQHIVAGDTIKIIQKVTKKVNTFVTITIKNINPDAIYVNREDVELRIKAGKHSYSQKLDKNGVARFLIPKEQEFRVES